MSFNSGMDSLFFSYGHDHYEETVKYIKERLEKKGFNIFFDRVNLKAGGSWDNQLEEAIYNCHKFIFFITKYSARRPDGFCLNEILKAIEYKKEIIPILLEEESLPLSINQLQYIDFQDNTNVDFKIENLLDVLIGIKHLDTEGIQAKLLASLKPINFAQDFNRHKNFTGREWVIRKISPLLNSDTRILWITAEAGYGKSALAVYLANNHPDVIGVHFCSFNAPEKNDPLNVIKTMAYNFHSQISGYAEKIQNIDINAKSLDILVDELILNPLEQITDNNKNYIFIIDAIDEAKDKDGQNYLANLIRDKLYMLPSHIKIIITSRPEPYLREILSQFNPIEFRAEEVDNNNDCRELIGKKLNEIDMEIDKKDFTDKLLKQSQGNMLYINKYFEAIKDNLISKPYDPNIFPSNLNGLYASYFNRIFLNNTYEDEYSIIFEQLLIFEDAISINLLASILELSKVKLKRRLRTIGSFVKELDGSYEINHKSIKDWLQDDNNSFQVDMEDGEIQLETFLKKVTADIYVQHSSNNMFNYLLLKYFYENHIELNNYFELLQSINIWEDKIQRVIQLDNFLLEKREYELSMVLQKIIKKILNIQWDNKQNINILQYYFQVVQSAIISNKEIENDKLIESYFKKIEKISSSSLETIPDTLKEIYSDITLRWSKILKEKSSEKSKEFLDKSKKVNNSILNKDTDKQLEFEAEHLIVEGAITAGLGILGGIYAFGRLGAAAGLPGFGFLGGVAGIACGAMISNEDINRDQANYEKIKLYEENLLTIEKSLANNPQKWIKDYLEISSLIVPLYVRTRNLDKAKNLFNKSIAIIRKLNKQNPNRWQELYNKFQSVKFIIK